jgi:hypothetical protein
MRRKTHDRVARELARILHLDERLVLMGARFPDLDNVIGRHRKTLHNPHVLAGTTLVHPAVFIGCASHLLLDLIPSKLERIGSAFRGVFEVEGC